MNPHRGCGGTCNVASTEDGGMYLRRQVEMMDYELLRKLYDIETFVGYSDEEINELCDGFDAIPAALREFWKKCGNTDALFGHSNDPWITLDFVRKYKWVKETN